MLLAFDLGNSHLFGGVLDDNGIMLRFRFASQQIGTSDQLGLFFRSVLRENQLNVEDIQHIAMCSVVPALDYSVTAACIKYFNIDPFVIRPGIKTGMKLGYKNPLELGADRLTCAVAANELYPKQNIIVIDLGTATTFCTISLNKEYLGGMILPGLKTSMQALSSSAAKLSSVEIIRPTTPLGKTTEQSMQAGIYYGHLGAMRQLIQELRQTAFAGAECKVISTGGFAYLFENENLFDVIEPDLVLTGLKFLYYKNM